MIEPATATRSTLRWEEQVLGSLGFLRWPWSPASPTRIAVLVSAVLAIIWGPPWLSIPGGTVLIALAVGYWFAFGVRIVREFRAGFRGDD